MAEPVPPPSPRQAMLAQLADALSVLGDKMRAQQQAAIDVCAMGTPAEELARSSRTLAFDRRLAPEAGLLALVSELDEFATEMLATAERVQQDTEGGTCLRGSPVRRPDRGRQSDRRDPRAPRFRGCAPGRRRHPRRSARTRSTSPGRLAVVLGHEVHGLGPLPLDALATVPMHGRRVAQRRHGRHRRVLRGPATAARALVTVSTEPLEERATRSAPPASRHAARREPRRAGRRSSALPRQAVRAARGPRGDQVRAARGAEGDGRSRARRRATYGRGLQHVEPSSAHATDADAAPATDLTLGGTGLGRGHLHLVTRHLARARRHLRGLGYHVYGGPRSRTNWHNFELAPYLGHEVEVATLIAPAAQREIGHEGPASVSVACAASSARRRVECRAHGVLRVGERATDRPSRSSGGAVLIASRASNSLRRFPR